MPLERESIEDADVVVVAEDAADSLLGCVVMVAVLVLVLAVERDDSTGFKPVPPGTTEALCAFRKVLRAVGEVVDNVSKRRLVELLPKSEGTLSVSNESLGRLAGDGRVVVVEGKMVVVVGLDGGGSLYAMV
jgi:hypothetical protein